MIRFRSSQLAIGALTLITAAATVGFLYWHSAQGSTAVVGIVIPHHDMVAPARLAYLKKIASTQQPATMVVLSPDHFNQNRTPITAADKEWVTSRGILEPDTQLLSTLTLPINNQSFDNEHGITSLLNNLKEVFPHSRLLPVMLSRSATYAEVSEFISALNTECPQCLLVASVDFSHTSTLLGARLHDRLTYRALSATDPITLYRQAEVDSPESLAALTLWARLHDAPLFSLFSHTSAGEITNTNVGEMTTHFIGGYSKGEPNLKHQNEVTLMIGGDVMFARGVDKTHADDPSYSPFSELGERFFWGVDIAIVNLEGVFSLGDYSEGWYELPPRLRFSSNYIPALTYARINAVSMANNHTFDGGEGEALYTSNSLRGQDITTLGYPRASSTVLLKENGTTKVAIIGIATHEQTGDIAADVLKYSKAGYRVITYLHWGNEYETTHTETQEEMAKRLINAGADLVVGSHPHVVQDVSVYQGVPIVYSLGNLLFDQNQSPATTVGAVLSVALTPEGTELSMIPVHTYLTPKVVASPEAERYQAIWTEPWVQYKTGEGEFLFPYQE